MVYRNEAQLFVLILYLATLLNSFILRFLWNLKGFIHKRPCHQQIVDILSLKCLIVWGPDTIALAVKIYRSINSFFSIALSREISTLRFNFNDSEELTSDCIQIEMMCHFYLLILITDISIY